MRTIASLLLKFTIPLALILFCCPSCKKEHPKRYSTWWVNNDSFSTNNVEFDLGKVFRRLAATNVGDRFAIYVSAYGEDDTARLTITGAPSPKMNIVHNNRIYVPIRERESKLVYKANNLKDFSVTLLPTYFRDESDSTDSVLVHGVFITP